MTTDKIINKVLTVTVPVYNTEKYLDKCLDSLVVSSELMDILEVLVVIDGSKDNSIEIAQKYEMNYRTVNLYISDFEDSEMIDLSVQFRALYPVEITGLSVRAYDYYNPQVNGNSLPIKIIVEK